MIDANWNQRLIAFVREADREAAGSLLMEITKEQNDVNSFSVPVLDIITRAKWYGCSSACNEQIRTQLLKSLGNSGLTARYVILRQNQGIWKVYRSSNELLIPIGGTWDINTCFRSALTFLGFERVQANGLR